MPNSLVSTGPTYGAVTRRGVMCSGTGTTFTTTTPVIAGVIALVQTIITQGDVKIANNFGLVINDLAGLDILRGQGATVVNTGSTNFVPIIAGSDGTNTVYFPRVVNEVLSIVLTATGAGARSVDIVFYYR